MNTITNYPVFNAHSILVGEASTATKAAEILFVDAMSWDFSGKTIQATFSSVSRQFAWADTRLPTESLVPLLKILKK